MFIYYGRIFDTSFIGEGRKSDRLPYHIRMSAEYDKTNRPSGSPVPHRDGDRQDGGWTHQVRQVRQGIRVVEGFCDRLRYHNLS